VASTANPKFDNPDFYYLSRRASIPFYGEQVKAAQPHICPEKSV
jgi:hypothetical protein